MRKPQKPAQRKPMWLLGIYILIAFLVAYGLIYLVTADRRDASPGAIEQPR
jgi:hypothetical protein